MRGTHAELDPVRRAVVHAFEMAGEDAERWCSGLTEAELRETSAGLPSIAFHLRHMARSLDRLLTYAEDLALDADQVAKLATEHDPDVATALQEFYKGVESAVARVSAIDPKTYTEPRGIGRERLPTTVAGLLIHCAEHTQRHAGQMVTTAKLIRARTRNPATTSYNQPTG